MTIGRVTDVVHQSKRFDQVLVQSQGPANRSGNRGDFLSVGQAGAVIIAHATSENLHLAAQAAVGRAMQDTIPVSLERSTIGMFRFNKLPSSGITTVLGIGSQELRFPIRVGGKLYLAFAGRVHFALDIQVVCHD